LGAACLALAAALPSCARVTGLPEVPASVTRADAGLDGIVPAAERARLELRPLVDASAGVGAFAALVEAEPENLAIGNAFRMEVYREKRQFLKAARERGERSPTYPDELRAEPLATLKRLAATQPARELRIQIALA